MEEGEKGKRKMEEEEWARQEFEGIELGDKRRKKRLIQLAEQRGRRPNASIAASCEGQAATKAAYRLLDNEEVGAEAILEGHYQASIARAKGARIVLAVQDTTLLNYSGHPATQGLGYLQDLEMRGMLVHTTLLVTPERLPLGMIDQQVWVREADDFRVKREERKARRTAEKESQKWLVSLEATARAQQQLGEPTHLISVGDSEADVYDLFRKAVALQQDVLIRAAYDRNVAHPAQHLWAHLQQQALAGEITLQLPRRPGKAARMARLAVRFAPVTLHPPTARRKEPLPQLTIWGLLAQEIDPPSQEEGLEWLLLTTLPVKTFSQACTYLDWYACRWLIETYHKVLKSGCRVEERQFADADNLQRYLALDAVVAWRVLYLTMLSRQAPDLPCTAVLETHEWQALYCFLHKTPRPPQPVPSLSQAILWVAQLGGFLGRKNDRDPGPMSVWRGLQRLSDIAAAWSVFHAA
jgi:hypothetical protein